MHLHHVQLLTQDLAGQLEFYQNVLGLTVVEHSATSVTFQVGGSRLEFVRDSRNVFYHFAFNIPSNKLKEAKTWLSEQVPLIKDASGNDTFHSQNWNANQVYFYDVGGNVVECIARHTLDNCSSRAFSGRSLECISELGIVTDDVPQTVKQIRDLTSASLYRTNMDEEFVPVGNETGLFIIVKKNRIWFPETKPAVVAPFKVKIADGQSRVLELDNTILGVA
jgi:catechol 2,3-dioxygenase-like lactoylglutathione lyase family enzyme